MKKLLLILFILPLLGFSQIVTSGGKVVKANITYNLDDYAYEFNGTDNYIDTGVKVTGSTAMNFKAKFIVADFLDWRMLFACGVSAGGGLDKGFYIRLNKTTGEVIIITANGTTLSVTSTGIILTAGTFYDFEFIWSGLTANDATLIINGSTTTHTLGREWVGDSEYNLVIGQKNNSTFMFKGEIGEFTYTINGNSEAKIPLLTGYSNKVYSVDNGDTYTIQGTVTQPQWVTQTNYSYGELYGVTKVEYLTNTAYIPYLKSGTPLYPSVSPIINASETIVNYPANTYKIVKL